MVAVHEVSENRLHDGACHGEYGDEESTFGNGESREHKEGEYCGEEIPIPVIDKVGEGESENLAR